jgi:hypothetical protein
MLIAIALPQPVVSRLRILESGTLFRARNESKTVRVLGHTLNEKVDVIWHEAVRGNCELFFCCDVLELRQDAIDHSGICEEVLSTVTAERQRIAVQPRVVETLQMTGPVICHGR